MENKKGNVSTVFFVIAIILIVVMGALLYMQKTEADKQITELKNNASELQEAINKLQEKDDLTTNSKDIYEKCEEKFSNVEYRRETSSSNCFIKDGILYAGDENLTETHANTTGIVGKAKYAVSVDKQTGIAIVLNENGKLFINEGLSNDFSSILEEHKILEIINIPNEDGHLLLTSDGKILKLDGTLYLDLLKEDEVKYDVEVEMSEIENIKVDYTNHDTIVSSQRVFYDKYYGKTLKITGYVSSFGDEYDSSGFISTEFATGVGLGNSETYETRVYVDGITYDQDIAKEINNLKIGQKISIIGVLPNPDNSMSLPVELKILDIIK